MSPTTSTDAALPAWLSVVIPAYNEAERLPRTLGSMRAYLMQAPYRAEVLVVDDGSTDATLASVETFGCAEVPVRVVRRAANGGKGAAVRDGLRAATGQFVLLMDADESAPISEVEKLLGAARDGAPVVIGSRYVARGSVKVRQPWYRVVISRLGNLVIRLSVLPGVKDSQCGFKLLSRAAADDLGGRLTRNGFSFDIELLVLARGLGYEVREVPVDWHDDPATRLHVVRASTKLVYDLVWIAHTYRGLSPAPQPARADSPRGDALAT